MFKPPSPVNLTSFEKNAFEDAIEFKDFETWSLWIWFESNGRCPYKENTEKKLWHTEENIWGTPS